MNDDYSTFKNICHETERIREVMNNKEIIQVIQNSVWRLPERAMFMYYNKKIKLIFMKFLNFK